MKVSKQNISPNPNYDYKNGFFRDKDCFYNFVREFEDAEKSLRLAQIRCIYNTELDKKITCIRILLKEIEIE